MNLKEQFAMRERMAELRKEVSSLTAQVSELRAQLIVLVDRVTVMESPKVVRKDSSRRAIL